MSSSTIQPAELGFFSTLAASPSLSAAGREMGVSTAAVSKHLAQMERRLGVVLVNRSTRRMSLTPEGELLLEHARRILREIDALDELIVQSRASPKGLLRVNATLGFGRTHIAPVISDFVRLYPEVDVQLQLSVHPPSITDDVYDVCVRFGEPPDGRVVARRIAPNRRVLCAAPAYLERHGRPRVPRDLMAHQCIGIRQGDEAYGLWRLTTGRGSKAHTESIKITGHLTTNDGEIAVLWALQGHGIVMRAEWDVNRHLAQGLLEPVLPQYQTPAADVYAVYPQRHQFSTRVQTFVKFLAEALAQSGELAGVDVGDVAGIGAKAGAKSASAKRPAKVP